MELLLALLVAFAVVVVAGLLVLKLFLGLLWVLVTLPFKILGALLHVAFGVVGVFFKGLGLLVGFLGLVLGFFVMLLVLPLLPLLILGAAVWLLVRAFTPAYRPA